MANRKITDLTALTAGSQATGDLLPIVDVSESAAVDKNKKITVENLFKGIPGNVGIGTTNPFYGLHIITGDNAGLQVENNAGSVSRINLKGNTTTQSPQLGCAGNNLVFRTAFSERMRIDSAGKVGIGTSNPDRLLQIQSANPIFRMQDSDGTNTYGEIQSAGGSSHYDARSDTAGGAHIFRSWDGSVFDEKVRITNTGRLGIGTNNPVTLLQLSGTGTPTLRIDDADGTSQFGQLVASNGTFRIESRNDTNYGAIMFRQRDASTVVERMRINSNGRVGIGASNPSSKLHVKVDGTSQVIQTWQADLGTNDTSINLTGPTTDSATEPFTFQTDNSITFEIDATERLRIGDNGEITASTTHLYLGETDSSTNELNIGLGRTTNGYAVIDLIGDATYTNFGLRMIRNNTGANTSSMIQHRGTGVLSVETLDSAPFIVKTNSTECMRINSGGAVAFSDFGNMKNQQGVVTFNGFAGKQGVNDTSPGNVHNFNWTGSTLQAWVDTTHVGTLSFSSDYRAKQNIQSISVNCIDRIKQLRPVEYQWANYKNLFVADGITREGFIAHEVADVISSGANGPKDDPVQVQSLQVDAILSVTVKALQEAIAKIETLETKVAALEAQ